MFEQQYQKMSEAPGFVAALDQSGGSTPKTLQRYGLEQWENEAEMFDLVHAMRSRIMASRSFDGDRILATILFAQTVDREVAGQPTPRFLWDVKHIVPIVKVDRGLEAEVDGAQLMKPIDDLDEMVQAAGKKGVRGRARRPPSPSSCTWGGASSRAGWCRSWSPRSTSPRPTRQKQSGTSTICLPRVWTTSRRERG